MYSLTTRDIESLFKEGGLKVLEKGIGQLPTEVQNKIKEQYEKGIDIKSKIEMVNKSHQTSEEILIR